MYHPYGSDTEETELLLELSVPVRFPSPFLYQGDLCSLHCKDSSVKLVIPGYTGILKFFYDNYKDYYYLPEEDMAIHKSVASYVDKDHRKKATKETCYISQKDCFVPLAKDLVPDGFPLFRTSLKDRRNYLLVRDAKQYFSSHSQEIISFYLEEALHQK